MEKKLTIKIMNELLLELNLNPNKLASDLSLKRSQCIYDILDINKNVGISKNMADKICAKFPQINKVYLLTGEGKILNAKLEPEKNPENKNNETITIPTKVFNVIEKQANSLERRDNQIDELIDMIRNEKWQNSAVTVIPRLANIKKISIPMMGGGGNKKKSLFKKFSNEKDYFIRTM
jgi:hypothetical protein